MSGRKIKNMEEFAEVSGISRPTVSKYFHDPGSVRKTTRAKIESALAMVLPDWFMLCPLDRPFPSFRESDEDPSTQALAKSMRAR